MFFGSELAMTILFSGIDPSCASPSVISHISASRYTVLFRRGGLDGRSLSMSQKSSFIFQPFDLYCEAFVIFCKPRY